MKLDKIFYNIGKKIAGHPVIVIIISLMITTLLMVGLMFLEFEVRSLNNYSQE
jgi:hypothetical protein